MVHRDARVGRSVQLHQLHTEAILEVRCELGHGHAPTEPGGIVAVAILCRLLVQHRQGRTHEIEDRGAGCANLVPESRRREPVADSSGRCQQHGGEHRQHSRVDVKHRERAVQHVVAPQLQVVDHQLGLADRVAVRQHTTLRRSGGARREHNHRRIRERVQRWNRRRIVCAQRSVIDHRDARQLSTDVGRGTSHDHTTHVRKILEHAGKIRHELGLDDYRVGTAEVQRVHQRSTAELGVEERRHRAEGAQRQPCDRELGPVWHQDGHKLATLYTEVGEAACKAQRPASSFAERELARREP